MRKFSCNNNGCKQQAIICKRVGEQYTGEEEEEGENEGKEGEAEGEEQQQDARKEWV